MRRSRLVAPLMALVLLIPAGTAYAEDQEVVVHVLPPDTLALGLEQVDFGGIEQGMSAHMDFWMNVTNTTDLGFTITVAGDDLQSFDWEGCGQNGCWNPVYTGTYIESTNLTVNGGDLGWWDSEGNDVVVPASVQVTPTAQTVVTAGAAAHGEFGFDSPMASLDLAIPADAAPMLQYRTVLTYTITGPTP